MVAAGGTVGARADGWTGMGRVGGSAGSVEAGRLGAVVEAGEVTAELKLQAKAGMTSSKQIRNNRRLKRDLAWKWHRVGITSSILFHHN